MTANRVATRLTYKMNIGNYESFEIQSYIESDVMSNESTAEADERVFSLTEQILQHRVAAARKAFKL